MADTTFVSGTTITSAWLNDVNDFLYTRIGSTTDADDGAGMVGYSQDLVYDAGTVGDALTKRAICVTDSPWLCDPTGATPCGDNLQLAATAAEGNVLLIPPGTYDCSDTNTIILADKTFLFGYGATLDFSGASGYGSRVVAQGTVGSPIDLTVNADEGDSVITVTSVAEIAAGDYLRISSDALVPTDAIGGTTTQQIGEWVKVASISGLNITIQGALFDSYTTADNALIEKLTPKTVAIQGLTVLGRGIAGTDVSTLEAGFKLLYTVDSVIRDCHAKYCDYNGVRIDQSPTFLTDNTSSVHGPRASGSHTAVIQYGLVIIGATMTGEVRGHVSNGGKHGIVWSENSTPGVSRGVTIRDCTVFGTWAGAYVTHESNDRCAIVGCKAYGCNRGMDIRVRRMQILGNELYGIADPAGIEDGIYLSGDARDLMIADNVIVGWRYGIRGYDSGWFTGSEPSNIVIRGNTIDTVNQIGIYLQQTKNNNGFTGVIVESNKISEFAADAIRIEGEFEGAVVRGNSIIASSAPTGYGVRLMGTNKTRIVRNTFDGVTPVRLENDTQGSPASPRNPILVSNDWDYSASFLSSASGSQVVLQDNIEVGDSSLVIASGVITVPAGVRMIYVDTESSAASDDLDTISGGATGDLIVIRAVSSSRTVVLKDGTGNLALNGDFSCDNAEDSILLRNTGSGYAEVSRSDNAA